MMLHYEEARSWGQNGALGIEYLSVVLEQRALLDGDNIAFLCWLHEISYAHMEMDKVVMSESYNKTSGFLSYARPSLLPCKIDSCSFLVALLGKISTTSHPFSFTDLSHLLPLL